MDNVRAAGRLAYVASCRSCTAEIYVAVCTDGFWRAFDQLEMPSGSEGSWAWRKRRGMEETDLVPGHPLHYCYGHQEFGPDHREYVNVPNLSPADPEPLAEPAPSAEPAVPAAAMRADVDVHLPSPDEIERARSVRGGWTQATLAAWGVPWPPPKGWREELVARWHNLV